MSTKIIVQYREAPTDKADWWELYEVFEDVLIDGTKIIINAGYVTDFASVPWILWSLFPPIGKYNRAALIHDYLYDLRYREDEIGEYQARKFADDQFLHFANKSDPKNWLRHYLMYLMVRLFGKRAWRANK